MKHPGHKTAKNEYSGRSNTKLNKSGKELLQDELKRFNEHVKNLMK